MYCNECNSNKMTFKTMVKGEEVEYILKSLGANKRSNIMVLSCDRCNNILYIHKKK